MALSNDWMSSLFVILRAFGFYMKKLFFPFPLNIAIMEVDPLYEVLAVLLGALCLYIATRRTLLSAVFISGVLFIMPAFLLAFGQAAWTPYAERYLYIASAFIIISIVVYLYGTPTRARIKLSAAVIMIILSTMFFSTLARSITWQSDLKLYKDAVEKTPTSRELRVSYGELLINTGDYASALAQLEQGRLISSLEYDERFDLYTSYIYYKQGKLDEAIKLGETTLKKSRSKSATALKHMIELLNEKKRITRSPVEKSMLHKEILSHTMKLFELNHDPRLLLDISAFDAERGKQKSMAQQLHSREEP